MIQMGENVPTFNYSEEKDVRRPTGNLKIHFLMS